MESMSHAQIFHETGIPRRTVSNFIKRLENRHSTENLPRPGRLRKMTASEDKRIIAAAETHTRSPFTELPNLTNIDTSVSTIQRRLHENHIHKRRAVKRPLLNARHTEACLKWAIAALDKG
jgi:hypothetical protein